MGQIYTQAPQNCPKTVPWSILLLKCLAMFDIPKTATDYYVINVEFPLSHH